MTRENVNTEVREDRGKEKISENEIFVQKMSEIVIKERVVREKRERTSTSSSISSSRDIYRARVLDVRRVTVCIPSVLEVKTHFNFFFQFETLKKKKRTTQKRAHVYQTQ